MMRSSDQKDDSLTLNFEILDCVETTSFFNGNYVTCLLDTKWWIGMIVNVFKGEGDGETKLMCFNQKTNRFKWPSRDANS